MRLTSAIAKIDFTLQRNELLGIQTDISEYQTTNEFATSLLTRKNKKPSTSSSVKPKEQLKVKEMPDFQYRQPVIPRPEEPTIAIENNGVMCSFEFACFLSSLHQRAMGNVVSW